jgi:hypothetical protein
VAAVETITPRRGPAAGSSRYLDVRLKHGGHITITEWQHEAAADRAVESYGPHASMEISGTRIKTLTVLSPNVEANELRRFDGCGLDEP